MQKQESGKRNLEFWACMFSAVNSMSRKRRMTLTSFSLIAAFLLTAASAQESNNSKPEQATTPAVAKRVINLWPGVAPGSEQWKQSETNLGSGGMETTANVSVPTLTVYLPDPAVATGTAIIIAPGGGFIGLSINSEGHEVAKGLVARGFAAIVLKYRTKQIEGKDAIELGQSARAAFMAQLNNHALIADISPDRIVFTGFSAGGMITELTAIQSDVSARPNYAAPIYGATFPDVPSIPKEVPPFFMAMAQDDNLAGPYIVRFYEALKAARHNPEFHIYNHGGHGWGMRKQGTSSDHWIDEFYWWLEAQGLTRPHK